MGRMLPTRFDVLPPLRRIVGAVVDLCYPRGCADCGGELEDGHLGPVVCGECRDLYMAVAEPRKSSATAEHDATKGANAFCRRCGSFAVDAWDPQPDRCRGCREWTRTAIDGAVPLGRYEDRLRDAVLRMKSPAGDGLSVAIADVLWETRQDLIRGIKADVIVPIPMHRWRRLVRGATSAERLAEQLGRNWGVPVRRGMLSRRRNTLAQGGLTPDGRRRNVAGAFRAGAGYVLRGLRVVLVDDVLTTGATVNEAARVLRRAGAKSVHAVVVARTGHPG